MKSLREQFEEILTETKEPKVETFQVWRLNLIDKLLAAVKERDSYVVGEDEKDVRGHNTKFYYQNILRAEIRQRQQQTLGEAEDWTKNPI